LVLTVRLLGTGEDVEDEAEHIINVGYYFQGKNRIWPSWVQAVAVCRLLPMFKHMSSISILDSLAHLDHSWFLLRPGWAKMAQTSNILPNSSYNLEDNLKKDPEYRKQVENELNRRFNFTIEGSKEATEARKLCYQQMARKLINHDDRLYLLR
jgi:hypothetical protein